MNINQSKYSENIFSHLTSENIYLTIEIQKLHQFYYFITAAYENKKKNQLSPNILYTPLGTMDGNKKNYSAYTGIALEHFQNKSFAKFFELHNTDFAKLKNEQELKFNSFPASYMSDISDFNQYLEERSKNFKYSQKNTLELPNEWANGEK